MCTQYKKLCLLFFYINMRWLNLALRLMKSILHGPQQHNHHPPRAEVNHPFLCVVCSTGLLGALRATATPRRGPDQEVNLKKISDCGGRMT